MKTFLLIDPVIATMQKYIRWGNIWSMVLNLEGVTIQCRGLWRSLHYDIPSSKLLFFPPLNGQSGTSVQLPTSVILDLMLFSLIKVYVERAFIWNDLTQTCSLDSLERVMLILLFVRVGPRKVLIIPTIISIVTNNALLDYCKRLTSNGRCLLRLKIN